MGAFGGQLRLDGGLVDGRWLSSLGGLLARRGPDGELVSTDGPFGVVYRPYGDLSEDHKQSSLWQWPESEFLAFDGRLDNGPELSALLGLKGEDASSDAAILFAGFRRFNTDFVGLIVGDFSLVHWAPEWRTLTLGRDAAGARTLYYHHSPGRFFAFASDLGSLVEAANLDRTLDEVHIAGFLGCEKDHETTIYRLVKSVLPAQCVTVSVDGKIAKRTVWSLSVAPEITYKHDREYEEHFAQLFDEAVSARLRTNRPVVAELSGGLDSSSIVCVADRLLRARGASADALSTVSMVFRQSPTANETGFISVIEQHCGRESLHVADHDALALAMAPHADSLHVLSASLVVTGWDNAVSSHMQRVGARVLLSGVGGDEMFCSTNVPIPGLADLLVQGRLRELHRELAVWSRAMKESYVGLLWRSLDAAIAAGRWSFKPLHRGASGHSWLHPRLRAYAARPHRALFIDRHVLPSQLDHIEGYRGALNAIQDGSRQEYDARYVTYPCLHRPLVEFLYGVPFSQKLRCGESRSLQRRALRNTLPAAVLRRRGKAQTTEGFLRGLLESGDFCEALLTRSLGEARGYVDAARVRQVIRRCSNGLLGHEVMPIGALALESWLRTHDGTMRPAHQTRSPARHIVRAT
jgi:asparagine synthase (glutamine-hydrolysing)